MQEPGALVSPVPAQGVATLVVSELPPCCQKTETNYPSSKTNAPPITNISLNGIAYSTHFTPPPSQGIVTWEQRLTAFYSALYTFCLTPGPLRRKRLNDLFAQSSALFCPLCGKRRSQFRKVFAILLPKKEVGKKDGGNGTMPVISVEM